MFYTLVFLPEKNLANVNWLQVFVAKLAVFCLGLKLVKLRVSIKLVWHFWATLLNFPAKCLIKDSILKRVWSLGSPCKAHNPREGTAFCLLMVGLPGCNFVGTASCCLRVLTFLFPTTFWTKPRCKVSQRDEIFLCCAFLQGIDGVGLPQ